MQTVDGGNLAPLYIASTREKQYLGVGHKWCKIAPIHHRDVYIGVSREM